MDLQTKHWHKLSYFLPDLPEGFTANPIIIKYSININRDVYSTQWLCNFMLFFVTKNVSEMLRLVYSTVTPFGFPKAMIYGILNISTKCHRSTYKKNLAVDLFFLIVFYNNTTLYNNHKWGTQTKNKEQRFSL